MQDINNDCNLKTKICTKLSQYVYIYVVINMITKKETSHIESKGRPNSTAIIYIMTQTWLF